MCNPDATKSFALQQGKKTLKEKGILPKESTPSVQRSAPSASKRTSSNVGSKLSINKKSNINKRELASRRKVSKSKTFSKDK
jgi:hypothetical protein|tara:strand:- start:344 stop:589 length:246 start_codon:yes stop_codon:yes gene_type:complete